MAPIGRSSSHTPPFVDLNPRCSTPNSQYNWKVQDKEEVQVEPETQKRKTATGLTPKTGAIPKRRPPPLPSTPSRPPPPRTQARPPPAAPVTPPRPDTGFMNLLSHASRVETKNLRLNEVNQKLKTEMASRDKRYMDTVREMRFRMTENLKILKEKKEIDKELEGEMEKAEYVMNTLTVHNRNLRNQLEYSRQVNQCCQIFKDVASQRSFKISHFVTKFFNAIKGVQICIFHPKTGQNGTQILIGF
jgi:hypothetical protein